MKAIESGQDWKIAALRSSFHVHFLFGGNMKDEFMNIAFECAEKAFELDEVPVGAVIVKDNQVIAKGYNRKEKKNSIFEHAELIAIRDAEKKLKNWRLEDCDIYVTLDPCPMCASAIKQARIKNVYSALENSDSNNNTLITNIFFADKVNSSVNYFTNLCVERSQNLLKLFFEKKRKK